MVGDNYNWIKILQRCYTSKNYETNICKFIFATSYVQKYQNNSRFACLLSCLYN